VKSFLKATMAGLLTAAIAGAGVVGLAGTAFAAQSAPPFEFDANSAAPYGNITFYNAEGDQVTSGTNLASPWAYAVAGTAKDTGATNASLAFAVPTHGESTTLWSSSYAAGPTTFSPSIAGAPADIAAFAPTYPVVATGSSTAINIVNWAAGSTLDSTTGYANTIEVRMTDSGAGGHGTPTGSYWESDIGFNTTSSPITVDGTTVPANGWALLFPFNTATTLTLTTSATGGQLNNGSSITLTAVASQSVAGDAVQFFDNGTYISGSLTTSTGSATYTFSYVPPSNTTNVFTADFVPGDAPGDETGAGTTSASIVAGSVAAAVTVTTSPPRVNSSITLSTSNASIAYGASVTFTSTVTEADSSTPAGTVEFFVGPSPITGCTNPVTVPPEPATCTTTALPSGTDNITAEFTPTNTSGYNGITSSVVVETVAAPVICNLPGSVCSDTQNIQVTISPGTITVSTPYTATNPFVLPNLALSSDGTYLASSATFPTSGGTGTSTTAVTTAVANVTTLSGGNLVVASTTGFAPQGTLSVVTSTGTAQLTYTGITANDFTGVVYSAGSGNIAVGAAATGPNPQAIVVTSTASPAYAWTLSVAASSLTSTGGGTIPASGLGLTGGNLLNATGPGAYAGSVAFNALTAENPNPADNAPGATGLGSTPRTWATSSAADGTALMDGTLTLYAATSTPAGTYNGTITFSVS
jgi:hypothetical protein